MERRLLRRIHRRRRIRVVVGTWPGRLRVQVEVHIRVVRSRVVRKGVVHRGVVRRGVEVQIRVEL